MKTRRRELIINGNGYRTWRIVDEERRLDPRRTAILLCDVWDNHWCRGAVERLGKLLPRMGEVVESMRSRGATIVHSPSNTLDFSGIPRRGSESYAFRRLRRLNPRPRTIRRCPSMIRTVDATR